MIQVPTFEQITCGKCKRVSPAVRRTRLTLENFDGDSNLLKINEVFHSCNTKNQIAFNSGNCKILYYVIVLCNYHFKFLDVLKMCSVVHENHRGEMPLHIFCKKGNVDVVKAIINKEMHDINQQDYAGWTPLVCK